MGYRSVECKYVVRTMRYELTFFLRFAGLDGEESTTSFLCAGSLRVRWGRLLGDGIVDVCNQSGSSELVATEVVEGEDNLVDMNHQLRGPSHCLEDSD